MQASFLQATWKCIPIPIACWRLLRHGDCASR